MLTRRGFIGTMLASLGAAAIPSGLLWMPTPDAPVLAEGALVTLPQITRAYARLLAKELGDQVVPWRIPTDAVFGDVVITGGRPVTMTEHDHWGTRLPSRLGDNTGLDVDVLAATARAQAGQMRSRAAGRKIVMGRIPMVPDDLESAQVWGHGVSVRGLMGYDAWLGKGLLRVDALYGFLEA